MGVIHLYGYRSDTYAPVALVCTAAGKLIIDVSSILENPPTENEAGKAPTSEWAFDHDADVAAHHSEQLIKTRGVYYWTEADEGRLFPDGLLLFPVHTNHGWPDLGTVITAKGSIGSQDGGVLQIYVPYSPAQGGLFSKIRFGRYNNQDWSAWQDLGPDVTGMISDHKDITNAHHNKYTNAEAQAACNLNGDLYWSCPGSMFRSENPDTDNVRTSPNGYLVAEADNISCFVGVNLPHGAAVTAVKVYGNASAEAETWTLQRSLLVGGGSGNLATALINTEDSSIVNPIIDNSSYRYYIQTTSLDTNDYIYGARIKFTL